MAPQAKIIEEEEELLPLEVDETGKPTGEAAKAAEAQGAADDDDDDEQERAHLGAEDDADRKRLERQKRKERQRRAQKRTEQELERLRAERDEFAQRLARLEQGMGNTTLAQLDDRIAQAKSNLNQANAALTSALAKNNAVDTTKALEIRDQARDQLNYFAGLKQRMTAQQHDPRRQQLQAQQPQDDSPPEVKRNVDGFKRKFSWWDDNGGDEDSKIVLALDNAVADDGFDPADSDYWEELERRMRQKLPHRFEGTAAGGREQRSPRVGAGTGEGATRRETGKNYVRITPERKAAMIEAGAWDDPDKRKRMLKRYRDYDAAHAAGGRA